MFKDSELEKDAHAAVALEESDALINRFATLVRESGSADEETAGHYIVGRLRALGIPVTVYTPDLYLSVPEHSELQIVDGPAFACRPPAFALSTGDRETTGELCYVPSKYAGGTGDLFDTPKAAQQSAGDSDPVAGKIVLTEGFSMPGPVSAFERRGAVAQIYIHPGPRIHEGICTPIWGAPTAESIGRKPRTPVVSVGHPDGDALIALASEGAHVGIRTWLREGWFPCVLPVVNIQGSEDADEFLLIHGHYDSWYVGIGDNATGDAALLELARVLWSLRSRLKRSVRIAWWPGHSTGRYAGSTWYADTFADQLDDWCIAHLNIDSPGCAGATNYDEVMWMAEAADLCSGAIGDALGAASRSLRPLRAGDYSFNQIGPSAFYMLLSNIPAEERAARGFYAVGGCGGNVAWHTPQDELDVADLAILKRDLAVYLTTIVRALNSPLHPFDYAATVAEILTTVEQYRAAAGDEVDLQPVVDELQHLHAEIGPWRTAAEARLQSDPANAGARREANAVLRRLARILVPLGYARGERFDHDPAVKLPAVPRLATALDLAAASPELRPFVRTGLVRERNKVRAMVRAARKELA